MKSLRDLVIAWQAQSAACSAAFDVALAGINAELDSVGGYATTSPDASGYCQTFIRASDSFGGGVEYVGRQYGGAGPHASKVAPHRPEVGDRCAALEREWRAEAYALTGARDAVRERIARATGSSVNHKAADILARDGLAPEHVALALVMEVP